MVSDLTGFTIGLFERIDKWISPQVNGLERRVAKLEESTKSNLADAYRGVYSEDEQYSRGSLVTRSGSLWLALSKTSRTPGTSDDWKMIVKKGGTP